MLALSDTGDVYAWGGGGSGQLGLGRKKSYPSPQLVWGMMRKGVRQVGAGDYHSAALTHSGRLQMPLARHRPCRHPPLQGPFAGSGRPSRPERRALAAWMLMAEEQLLCADPHSICNSRYNGMVYTWGSSSLGQLGHGNDTLQSRGTVACS